jgi:hypothetical protein
MTEASRSDMSERAPVRTQGAVGGAGVVGGRGGRLDLDDLSRSCGRAIKKQLKKTNSHVYTNTQTYEQTHDRKITRTITTQTNTEEGGKPVNAKSLLAQFKKVDV